MSDKNYGAPMKHRRLSILPVCGVVLLSIICFAGCDGQSSPAVEGYRGQLSQAATTQTVLPAATQPTTAGQAPSATGTLSGPRETATAAITALASGAGTATPPVEGTQAPLPTPEGTPPDPLSRLNIYEFFSSANTLVRNDLLQVSGAGPGLALYTLTGSTAVLTSENKSNINVLLYDPTYREWNLTWASQPVSGTASPVLSTNQRDIGGLNGGDLLHTGAPVFILRTTTNDGRAHMQLFRWNAQAKKGELLKLVPTADGTELDTFDADLDLNVADLNDDGVYEVVGDNSNGVQVWKWDGQKYTPQEQR